MSVRRVLDFWCYGGRWWMNEPSREYYLLELESGHVVEIYHAADNWTLARIAD